LLVDGKPAAKGVIARTLAFRMSLDETLDCGEDTGTPVSEDYQLPFKFTGKLGKVAVRIGDAALTPAEKRELDEVRGRGTLAE
jgi:arylsulfatase